MSIAAEIARFYGQGKEQKNGAGWITCCPVHQEKTPSLAVTDEGDSVKVFCHVGCNFKEIKDRFRQDGLLPEWTPEKKIPASKTKPTRSTEPKKEVVFPEIPEKEDFIWKKSKKEGLENATKYLSSRSITIDPLPVCLKWNTYTDKKTKELSSSIVAAASCPTDAKVYAVQRLYIDTEDNKKTGEMMHGPCSGRGIWFYRKDEKKEILVGEGIENTLSGMQATGKNGVAALSWSGVQNLVIPEETDVIYITVDSDKIKAKNPMVGQKASVKLAKRFIDEKEDRKAFLVSPDDTCFSENPAYLDFNDLLQQDPTGESIRARFDKAVEIRDLQWTPPASSDETEIQSDAEKEIFERFVFLASENKIIDTRGYDIKDSMMIERAFTLSQAGHFYTQEAEDGSEKIIPLTKHWLMSDKKKIAYSLRYRPGEELLFENGDGRNYYNTFRLPYQYNKPMGAADQEKRLLCWHKVMDAVFHEHRDYIEDWFSFSLQQPEKRAGIMPICISNVGLGKSLVMSIMSRVAGAQNFSNAKILDVTGLGKSGNQWGDWIFNKKISCIEEINPEGETGISYKIVDALKDIITNETLSLNLKGGRNGTFRVFSNIIGFSNHKNCVKIPYGDRRFFIVDSTCQGLLQPNEYEELWDWINDKDNIFAVYQYLVNRKISNEFIPGQAKMTNAKRSLQEDGRSPLQQAFDLVAKEYPSDLITIGELQLAVSDAMKVIENNDIDYRAVNWNAEKQFQAILKTTTNLVADGKRIRIQRIGGERLNPSTIRAIRNGQDWVGATIQEIKDAMYVDIPWNWISLDGEKVVPF